MHKKTQYMVCHPIILVNIFAILQSKCYSSSNSQEAKVPKLRFPEFEGEWNEHTLGELGNFIKGAPLSKADISDEGAPFILYGELYTTYDEVINSVIRKTNRQVSPEL